MPARGLVSLIAITWATMAAAQQAPDPTAAAPSATQQAPQSASPTAPEAAAAGTDLSATDIIVTAQRRSQRLVDVPISIATASASDLERAGPTSLENLTKITPGIYLQRAVYGLSPTVRGIGSTLAASSGEQNVALYIDNIYYPTPTGNVFDLASVSDVEVLKGPQGTLFGRNATGGAILLHTLDPGFDLSGRFNVSYERFDQVRSSAYVNLPVTDAIAINGSVAYRYSRGYVRDLKTDDITNQGRSFTARGKLLIKPTDDVSLILTAAHADFSDPTGNTFQNLQPAPLLSLLGGGPIATDRFHSSTDTNQSIRTSTDEYSARAKLDTTLGTLSSYTAFLRNKLSALNDLDGTYVPQNVSLRVRTKTFSQEVNLASPENQPLTYVAGAYYFRNRPQVPVITQNGSPLFNSKAKNDAVAGYVDGTYTLGKLSLIAGVRYSYEKRRAATAFGVSAPSPATRFQRATDKQWTPRVGLRYQLADRTNLYATYSKGFKSGVFDQTSPIGPGVSPEKVDAFEVGLKSASRVISFNTAAFYYDYRDTQVNSTVSGPNGRIFNQLFNVPKSHIYGAEGDVTLRFSNAFDLRAALAYTHARYIDFPNAPAYTANRANPATLGGLIFANIGVDVSGNHMVRAPTLTASSTLSYHARLGGDSTFDLSLSPYYSSRVYFTFDNSQSQKSYVTLDGAATITLHGRTKVSVFGRNLTDRAYRTNVGQNALGLQEVIFATPRTYGVSLGYSF